MTSDSSNRQIVTPAGFGPKKRRGRLEKFRQEARGFIKKNFGLLKQPAFWRLVPRILTNRAKTAAVTPDSPVLFVATHHKVMTTYFNAVLRLLSFGLGRKFQRVHIEQPDSQSDVVLSMHGKLDLPKMGQYRGVHIMRDPRDMIVSGYHYHKWTHEEWVHRPDEDGVSYQQKLNRANKTDGLFMEIDHFIFFYRSTLENWDMDDPNILEVPYHTLMSDDRDQEYDKIFKHLGLSDDDLTLATDLMRLFEAKSRTGRKSGKVAAKNHLRSGKSGQWRAELEPAHLDYIEKELGHVLRKFGYPEHDAISA